MFELTRQYRQCCMKSENCFRGVLNGWFLIWGYKKNLKLAPIWKSNMLPMMLLKWNKVSPVYLMKGKKTWRKQDGSGYIVLHNMLSKVSLQGWSYCCLVYAFTIHVTEICCFKYVFSKTHLTKINSVDIINVNLSKATTWTKVIKLSFFTSLFLKKNS